MSGHDSVAEVALVLEPEVRRTMGNESVELDKGVRVEQQLEALARRQLAALVLLSDAFLATAEHRRGAHLLETRQLGFLPRHEIRTSKKSERWVAAGIVATRDVHRNGEQLRSSVD